MVDLSFVFKVVAGLISIGGVIVTLAVMQTKQNMNITYLKDRLDKVEKRVSNTISNQIKTEKLVGEIGLTLEHISKGIDELKKERKK